MGRGKGASSSLTTCDRVFIALILLCGFALALLVILYGANVFPKRGYQEKECHITEVDYVKARCGECIGEPDGEDHPLPEHGPEKPGSDHGEPNPDQEEPDFGTGREPHQDGKQHMDTRPEPEKTDQDLNPDKDFHPRPAHEGPEHEDKMRDEEGQPGDKMDGPDGRDPKEERPGEGKGDMDKDDMDGEDMECLPVPALAITVTYNKGNVMHSGMLHQDHPSFRRDKTNSYADCFHVRGHFDDKHHHGKDHHAKHRDDDKDQKPEKEQMDDKYPDHDMSGPDGMPEGDGMEGHHMDDKRDGHDKGRMGDKEDKGGMDDRHGSGHRRGMPDKDGMDGMHGGEPMGGMPGREGRGDMHERLGDMPETLEDMPERLGEIPERLGEIPERMGEIPERMGEMQDRMERMRDEDTMGMHDREHMGGMPGEPEKDGNIDHDKDDKPDDMKHPEGKPEEPMEDLPGMDKMFDPTTFMSMSMQQIHDEVLMAKDVIKKFTCYVHPDEPDHAVYVNPWHHAKLPFPIIAVAVVCGILILAILVKKACQSKCPKKACQSKCPMKTNMNHPPIDKRDLYIVPETVVAVPTKAVEAGVPEKDPVTLGPEVVPDSESLNGKTVMMTGPVNNEKETEAFTPPTPRDQVDNPFAPVEYERVCSPPPAYSNLPKY